MDFNLTEQQELLKKTARDFLTNECPTSQVKELLRDEKGYSPKLWRQMAELGWMGLLFPEEYGGMGGTFLDLFVLLEEMGRACVPGPFFSSVILGGFTILEAGNETQKKELLPKIAEGDKIVTLALTEPDCSFTPSSITVKATAKNGNYSINGTKLFVPDAHIADDIIVVARTKDDGAKEAGITLFLVDAKTPGITYSLLPTLAGDKQFEVSFSNVTVPKENMLGNLDKGWSYIQNMLAKATVAKCAEMVGGAQRVLEMAIDYAKERIQFDRPIGSFQAIQFHCVDIATDVDASRFIAYEAAWMLDEGIPCKKEVSIAKAWIGEAYRRVTARANQVHGGISYTEDHDLHLYFKQAKTAELWLGDADHHREIIAQEAMDK